MTFRRLLFYRWNEFDFRNAALNYLELFGGTPAMAEENIIIENVR